MSGASPPKGLGQAGRRLWRQTVAEWELTEDSLTLLRQACYCADACDRLQGLAAGQEPVILSRLGGRMANPVHVELRSERRMLLALMHELRQDPAAEDGGYGPLQVVR